MVNLIPTAEEHFKEYFKASGYSNQKDLIEFQNPYKINKRASYTTTYKNDLQELIKKLNDEVKLGNMSAYQLYQDTRKELRVLNQYNVQSFQCKKKSDRKNIANQLAKNWQPKVTKVMNEDYKVTDFTSLRYINHPEFKTV